MTTISVRISNTDKMEADKLFKKLGITTDLAINMFIKQCIRKQSLIFTPSLEISNDKLIKSLEESDVILDEHRTNKRIWYTDSESLFEELD